MLWLFASFLWIVVLKLSSAGLRSPQCTIRKTALFWLNNNYLDRACFDRLSVRRGVNSEQKISVQWTHTVAHRVKMVVDPGLRGRHCTHLTASSVLPLGEGCGVSFHARSSWLKDNSICRAVKTLSSPIPSVCFSVFCIFDMVLYFTIELVGISMLCCACLVSARYQRPLLELCPHLAIVKESFPSLRLNPHVLHQLSH